MASNKMKLRHLYRNGETRILEDELGVFFDGSPPQGQLSELKVIPIEQFSMSTETVIDLEAEDAKETEEKREYLYNLDMNQLRSMLKPLSKMPYKKLMKLKKEELVEELLN
jgi:hypothetical protein